MGAGKPEAPHAPPGTRTNKPLHCMLARLCLGAMIPSWQFAPDVSPEMATALQEAFRPEALDPVPGAPEAAVAHRTCGLVPGAPSLPVDLFVKVFGYGPPGGFVRRLVARADARREFACAVRLYETGLPVPRPLACAERPEAAYVLSQHVDNVPLADYLAVYGPREMRPMGERVGALAARLAALGLHHPEFTARHILVRRDADGRPAELVVTEAGRAEIGPRPDPSALAPMLATVAGSLLAEKTREVDVRRFLEGAAAGAADLGDASPEALLEQAHSEAEEMLTRIVRRRREQASPQRSAK